MELLARRLPGALVAACAVCAYLSTLSHGLVWDDHQLVSSIERNPFPAFLRVEFLEPGSGYYRPLVLASLWLDGILARVHGGSYHLTNILLHAANSLLVQRLLARLLSPASALFGGLVFALHPAATEPVSFVAGRTDLWAALFTLLLTNAWLATRDAVPHASATRWLAWAGLLVCGGLAKENALMLPAVLLAWDTLLPRRPDSARWWRRNIEVLGSAAAAVFTLAALRFWLAGAGFAGGIATLGSGEQWAAVGKLSRIPAVLATYARILVLPWPLTAFYMDPQVRLGATAIVATLVLLGGAAFVAGRGNGRLGLLGVVWLVAFLAPVSGLVRLTGAVVAERYLYLPLVGYAIVIGAVFAAVSRGRLRPLVRFAAPAVLLVFAVLTVRQSRVWRDEITLFEHTLRVSPDASSIRMALSESYMTAGRATESHRVRGEAFLKLGYYPQAIQSFERMTDTGSPAPEDLRRLGRALRLGGRPAEAATVLRRSIALAEYDTQTWLELGRAARDASSVGEAERAMREAIRIDEGNAEALKELGTLLVQAERAGEAIPLLRAAALRRADDAEIFNNLGVAFRKEGRWQEALTAGRQAARLNPQNPRVHFNLALSYAAAGDFPAARRERDLVTRFDKSLGEALNSRIR